MSNRYISQKILKKLYARSGNLCAFPGCSQPLFDEDNQSNICHIEGVNTDSPRHNSKLTKDQINSYENLILLCPNHHTQIDKEPDIYTVSVLKDMKKRHEDSIKKRLEVEDTSKIFIHKLQSIFQKNKFDEIFTQGISIPFPEYFYNNLESGYTEILNLLSSETALNCSHKKWQKELKNFAMQINNIMDNMSMLTESKNGFAVKHESAPKEHIDELEPRIKKIAEIYQKYRYYEC